LIQLRQQTRPHLFFLPNRFLPLLFSLISHLLSWRCRRLCLLLLRQGGRGLLTLRLCLHRLGVSPPPCIFIGLCLGLRGLLLRARRIPAFDFVVSPRAASSRL
jgi:hypothetical protein